MYLGSWDIDDYLPIPAVTHRFSSGAAYAPTAITYSIYEDGTTSGIDEDVAMGSTAPFVGVTGLYYARRQLTTTAGFEAGKNYLVVIQATVDSVAAIDTHLFQIKAKVDAEESVWEAVRASHATAGTFGEIETSTDMADAVWNVLPTGTVVADAGNSTTVFKTNRTETADDYWKNALVLFTAGNLSGQVQKVSAYNGTTKAITVSAAFTQAPAADETFVIVNR